MPAGSRKSRSAWPRTRKRRLGREPGLTQFWEAAYCFFGWPVLSLRTFYPPCTWVCVLSYKQTDMGKLLTNNYKAGKKRVRTTGAGLPQTPEAISDIRLSTQLQAAHGTEALRPTVGPL